MATKTIKREKSTSTAGHYVKNSVILPEVIRCIEKNEVSSELASMIWMIADRYSRIWKFSGYSFREDMVSFAVENLCKKALRFDPVRYSNPFAFYTTAIHRSFLQFISEEKKQARIRDKLLIDAGSNPSFGFQDDEVIFSDNMQLNEDIYPDELLKNAIDKLKLELDDECIDDDAAHEIQKKINELAQKDPYEKIGFRDRRPGPVTTYGPNDIIIDPVTGVITIKNQ